MLRRNYEAQIDVVKPALPKLVDLELGTFFRINIGDQPIFVVGHYNGTRDKCFTRLADGAVYPVRDFLWENQIEIINHVRITGKVGGK